MIAGEDLMGGVDPELEAQRIAQGYLTGMAHVRQKREVLNRQLLRGEAWNAKYDEIQEQSMAVDEEFSEAIAYWKSRATRSAKEVLWKIVDRLKNRRDFSPIGKSIVERLRKEVDVA